MIEFLESLDDTEGAKIVLYIEKLIEYKNNALKIPSSISKELESGIFELRVSHSDKISRSLYFYEKNREIIFTNGFIKKSQKTPRKEIELALKIKKELSK